MRYIPVVNAIWCLARSRYPEFLSTQQILERYHEGLIAIVSTSIVLMLIAFFLCSFVI